MNPKVQGSGIVTARPQAGPCPNGCHACYYNAPNYFEDTAFSSFPTPEEAKGKLVRVNDGHDSNLGGVIRLPVGHWLSGDYRFAKDTRLGIELTRDRLVAIVATLYEHPFWNTSIPRFDFPGPVMFTCNGRQPLYVECPANVMAVRIRCNAWEWSTLWTLADHYTAQNIPVLLTPMRYYSLDDIPPGQRIHYAQRKHILNEEWQLADGEQSMLAQKLAHALNNRGIYVLLCHGLCRDCGNCERRLYWQCLDRMDAASKPREDFSSGLCHIE